MMLVLILGETIAVISGSVVCVLASIPLLIVIKIITKRQAGLFVMIFFTLAIGFLNCKYAIRESNTVYGFKEEKVEIWGKVSQIKEINNNVEVILSNVKINEYKLEKFLVCFRKEDVNLSIGINVFVDKDLYTNEIFLSNTDLIMTNENNNQNIIEYVVKPGNTLSGIAKQYNTTVSELISLNNLFFCKSS